MSTSFFLTTICRGIPFKLVTMHLIIIRLPKRERALSFLFRLLSICTFIRRTKRGTKLEVLFIVTSWLFSNVCNTILTYAVCVYKDLNVTKEDGCNCDDSLHICISFFHILLNSALWSICPRMQSARIFCWSLMQRRKRFSFVLW